ncbi:MAG: manganese catalase family protein [Ruminococcus sp.]|nr:manganese catalase family protein [Ruminococcus sp.]
MWQYEKKLQYPVNIKNPNPALAKVIVSQLGGPDGELGAALRYLNQRYAAPCREVQAILNDIGSEELNHMEMIGTILYQLTRNLSIKEIKDSGFDVYFVDHTTGVYPIAASGVPFSASTFQSLGDPIADLNEDLAAEQKARVTYDNILRLADDPDVRDPIKFLREREIVHYQRFGEANRTICSMLIVIIKWEKLKGLCFPLAFLYCVY